MMRRRAGGEEFEEGERRAGARGVGVERKLPGRIGADGDASPPD